MSQEAIAQTEEKRADSASRVPVTKSVRKVRVYRFVSHRSVWSLLLQSPASVPNDEKKGSNEEESEEMEPMTTQQKIAAKILTTKQVYLNDDYMTPK